MSTSTVIKNSLDVLNHDDENTITNVVLLLKKIDQRLAKVEAIEPRLIAIESLMDKYKLTDQKITNVQRDVCDLKSDVKVLKDSKSELENNIAGISNIFDGANDDIKRNSEDVKHLSQKVVELQNQVRKIDINSRNSSNAALKSDINDLRCRSMRQNLLFFGLPENDGEVCEDLVKSFIRDRMHVTSDISFDRVHRFGKLPQRRDDGGANDDDMEADADTGARADSQPRPRPIVARFTYFKQREIVRKKAHTALKNSSFSVFEHSPPDVEAKRRELYPLMRKARNRHQRVRLVVDHLYVDGEEVFPTPRPQNPVSRGNKRRRVTSSTTSA